MRKASVYCLLFCIQLLTGCQFVLGGVDVKPVNSSVERPSNVAVYLVVSEGETPLSDLDESNFKVFENEREIPRDQSQLTLLDRDRVAVHHVVLLVDLSGKLDDAAQRNLERAITGFIADVTKTQGVSVFGFDGSAKIWELGEFERGFEGEPRFSKLEGGDPSRNLHGAVPAALAQLDARLMRVRLPVRVGTLVVFTRGPDVAGRETPDALYDTLESTDHRVLAIGLRSEDTGHLDELGRHGRFEALTDSTLGVTFKEAAGRLRDSFDSYYLLQYCSPARAGTPIVRLEVHHTTQDGSEQSGAVELSFDASGFGPGCDPRNTPSFKVSAKPPWQMDTTGQGQPDASTNVTSPPASAAGDAAEADADSDGDEGIVPPPEAPGYE